MNKACKELIEKAKPYNGEEIGMLYIINSGKRYSGFWGSNKFNRVILIGRNRPKSIDEAVEFYMLSTEYQSDKVSIESLCAGERCNVDIDGKLNCVRIRFNQTLIRQYVISDIVLVPAKSNDAKRYIHFNPPCNKIKENI